MSKNSAVDITKLDPAAQKYLISVLEGKAELPEDPFAHMAYDRFLEANVEVKTLATRIQGLEDALQKARHQLPILLGEAQGLAGLIVRDFQQRQRKGVEKKAVVCDPLASEKSLEDLRKDLGADRLEALDPQGRVLETAEAGEESRS